MAGVREGWQRTRQEVDARRRLFARCRRGRAAAGRLARGRRAACRAAPGAARQLLRGRHAHLRRKAQHALLAVTDLCARHLRAGLQVWSMAWDGAGVPDRPAALADCQVLWRTLVDTAG